MTESIWAAEQGPEPSQVLGSCRDHIKERPQTTQCLHVSGPHLAKLCRCCVSAGFTELLPCSCAGLDFSFERSEELDVNAFEDIMAFYESRK